ncbi:hypothetical protein HDV00_008364 [Rhizophlyctis rosea]|nr:hypothetical protein HDV00_008364 [Rhizophlyctis rosea]
MVNLVPILLASLSSLASLAAATTTGGVLPGSNKQVTVTPSHHDVTGESFLNRCSGTSDPFISGTQHEITKIETTNNIQTTYYKTWYTNAKVQTSTGAIQRATIENEQWFLQQLAPDERTLQTRSVVHFRLDYLSGGTGSAFDFVIDQKCVYSYPDGTPFSQTVVCDPDVRKYTCPGGVPPALP